MPQDCPLPVAHEDLYSLMIESAASVAAHPGDLGGSRRIERVREVTGRKSLNEVRTVLPF